MLTCCLMASRWLPPLQALSSHPTTFRDRKWRKWRATETLLFFLCEKRSFQRIPSPHRLPFRSPRPEPVILLACRKARKMSTWVYFLSFYSEKQVRENGWECLLGLPQRGLLCPQECSLLHLSISSEWINPSLLHSRPHLNVYKLNEQFTC